MGNLLKHELDYYSDAEETILTYRLIYSTVIAVAIIAGVVLAVFSLSGGLSAGNTISEMTIERQNSKGYSRVISLSPSITETLFALDLGEKVVGVTKFCTYPPAVLNKPRVGGYYDPNYEAIITLKPDIIVLLTSQRKSEQYFKKLKLNVLVVNHENISGIMDSIMTIGVVCGAENRARQVVGKIRKKINSIKEKTKGVSRPRVLVSVGRDINSGSFSGVYVSGKGTFYDEMITIAGGINAFQGSNVHYPLLSLEGLISLDSDVIVEMVPDLKKKGIKETMIYRQWKTLSSLKAVKNNRVYIFSQDFSSIPGPRFVLILEKMAGAVHPELNLGQQ